MRLPTPTAPSRWIRNWREPTTCAARPGGRRETPRKAIEDFSKAVELEPNLDNYFQRASTYQGLGDHARAIADFNKALEEDPLQPHI